MSILRVLSRNPHLAADPTIPKVQSKQSAFMSVFLKGLDNINQGKPFVLLVLIFERYVLEGVKGNATVDGNSREFG